VSAVPDSTSRTLPGHGQDHIAAIPVASAGASAPQCPPDPEGGPPKLPIVRLVVPEVGAGVAVEAELTRTELESARGLMYRTSMTEEHGMLFRMPTYEEHPFWMHNTCIPLDMLFLENDGTIVGILEEVPILNDQERTVHRPSSWVLETNAGWSRRHGVRAGQKVIIPPEARK
jgi:uncharacterized membrane protein (UPF0127 family)